MQKLLMRIVPVVLMVVAFIGYKQYDRNNVSNQVRDGARAFVQELPGYAENKEYLDAEFEKHHAAAFDQAFKMGGRRQQSTFDKTTYEACLIAFIKRDAMTDGHTSLEKSLEDYRKKQELPKVDF
jgi:hypothetical protein